MSVRVRVDVELLGVRSGLDERAVDMNLVRISPRDGRESIAERRDVMFNVVYITEVEISDPFP